MKRLAMLMAILCTGAQAQDTRTVTEPVLPPTCTILHARQGGDDTARIQAAIDQCQGGQAVRLTATNGERSFVAGPLTLKSGVTLLVDRGATLYASTNSTLYDMGQGTCGSVDAQGKGCRPFISADDTLGSGIMGEGVIDGQGGHRVDGKQESWWQLARRAQKEQASQNVPRLVAVRRSRNFTMYGITLRNSPNFNVAINKTDGFTAWGVKIDAPADARNTDGIDPGSSRNVTIAHSFLRTGDDSVAIKASRDGPTEYVSILHNHFYNGHGMSIGSETVGGVRHVLVEDLTMEGSVAGLRIKSDVSRGGVVSDIVYRDVCLRDVRKPIELDTHYTKNASGTFIPEFRALTFERVHSLTPGSSSIDGYDDAHQAQLRLDDVILPGSATIRHARLDGRIDTGAATCPQRFAPFPETRAQQARPQLSAAQAAKYAYREVLKYVGAAGQESVDPWDPLADPLATGAAFTPDYTVDPGGALPTIQAAINQAIANAPGRQRVYIKVTPGTYRELLYVPQAGVAITLYSLDPDASHTRIVADLDASVSGAGYLRRFGAQFAGAPPAVAAMVATLKDKPVLDTIGTPVAWIRNNGFQARNLTFENSYSDHARFPGVQHQAVAVLVEGADKVQFENVRFIGKQDTLFLRSATPGVSVRSFFHKSYVEGDVDFIFGDTAAYFQQCEIKSLGSRVASSYATAPNTNVRARYGFVFNDCDFTSDGSANALAGHFHLARQWFHRQKCTPYGTLAGVDGYACTLAPQDGYSAPRGTVSKMVLETAGKTIILNSRIGPHIDAQHPWSDWNQPGALSYRPVQYDADAFLANLKYAGIDLGYTPWPNEPFLAEYNNVTSKGTSQ
ncbi:MAG: pectinesterase family protein [Pseudomonadota bacterium]